MNSRDQKYKAQFTVNSTYRHLGSFDTAEEAARAGHSVDAGHESHGDKEGTGI
jgi:hypothetical protein